MQLNPAQQAAVEAKDGPQLILAGAGSGKTRTVVHRIGHLIANKGYAPHRILAVTFTNKAAQELSHRLSELMGDGGVASGTFHSISLRFLRSYADVLGYPKDFQILDSDDQKILIKRVLKARKIPSSLLQPYFLSGWIEQQKNAGRLPEQAESMLWGGLNLKDLYIAYQDELKQLERMDFSDLILNCVCLLRNFPSIASAMLARFDHILVDEYQDTNPVQHEWLCLLAAKHQNITVVGDDDQSIYGWRGADVRHILDFEKAWSHAQVHRLEENYRSTASILKLANAIISTNEERHIKALRATRDVGLKPEFHVCVDEYAEARHMASLFRQRHEHDVLWSKMAVLYRSNRQSLAIEQVFREENIPYRIIGGLSFFARLEIKDAIAFWALLNDCADAMHILRICNKPKRGIGTKGQETIAALLRHRGVTVADWVSSILQATALPAPMKKLLPLLQLIQDIQPHIAEMPDRGLMLLLEKSGYLMSLQALGEIEAESRMENIKTLQNYIELSLEAGVTPADFMDRVALMASGEEEKDSDAVNLMSLHRAKGLEFDTVVLAGVEDGLLPHQRALNEGEVGISEERRLLYVGVTRAENTLHLTSARLRRLFGGATYPEPSRFIADLNDDVLFQADKMKQPRMVAQAVTSAQGIAVGVRVNHPSFGDGLIVDLEGDGDAVRVAVEFDAAGLKRLMLKYAALTVI